MASHAALERGRDSFARAAWREAYEALAAADEQTPLQAEDLELFGRAAYMLGRDDEYVDALGRAHQSHLAAGAPLSAIRCAFWIGHSWLFRGHSAPAFGWFARAERLLDREEPGDVAERGYVMVARLLECSTKGDVLGVLDAAVDVAAIGERHGDRDLVAIGLMEQGHALVRLGRADDGLRLIDETMVAVTSGELSPIVAGIVYCNTIAFCRGAYQFRRVREWTVAFDTMVRTSAGDGGSHGLCLVHRAEIMTLGGALGRRARGARSDRRLHARRAEPTGRGDAAYRSGEVHRLRGEFGLAEAAYRSASDVGREPQPGLALMRLAQSKPDAAAATIRRAVAETSPGLPRVSLLPAYVEIMLATGDVDAASVASRELDEVAAEQRCEAVDALSSQVKGALLLAVGDPDAALAPLRLAWRIWQRLEAPYDAARARILLGRACRMVGDHDTAALEFQAFAASRRARSRSSGSSRPGSAIARSPKHW